MITKQEMFLDFIGRPATQFVIPVYQRVYAWSAQQCNDLWDDIMRAGKTGSAHFIGTILYGVEQGEGELELLDVIDGQQRTATLTLLLTALRDWLHDNDAHIDGTGADALNVRYLFTGTSGEGKLTLSRFDRKTMAAVLVRADMPKEDDYSPNVKDSYDFFAGKMAAGFTAEDARQLWRGMNRLLILSAELSGKDKPQLIFESLNSKGMPLTTADLIRNLLLATASYDDQLWLYEKYWAPIERLYSDDPDSTRLNAALHGYLAIKAPQLHTADKDAVYGAFRTFMNDYHKGELEHLLIGLKGFCETFAAKSQSAGSKIAGSHTGWGDSKMRGLINERKLFGD